MRPRRVLIIVQNLPVPFDRRVWQEATELQRNGYEVSIICPKGSSFKAARETIDGVRIYRHPLPLEARGTLGYALEYGCSLFWETLLTLRIALTHGFDAIHACNPPDTIFLIGGFFKLFGKKFLFDHHDINPELYVAKFGRRDGFYRLICWLERLTFRTADMSIATNESYRRIALTRGNMPPDRVFIVRSGPNLDRLKIMPPVPARRMGKRFLVGYVGVMGHQEGIHYLLEAARIITREWARDDVHFTLVGGGPALAELKTLAQKLQLDAVVNFTGRVSDNELLEVLNTADICVNPDEVNPMNDQSTMNKIMEYMALGKPIVQFDVAEGKFSAGAASLYAAANDARDFAAKIVVLLDDPAARERMGKFGRARVENELAWPHEAPKLLAAYEKLFADTCAHKTHAALPANLLMIGAFPADKNHIAGGVQAAVYGLTRALKNHPGIGSIHGISLPLKANNSAIVSYTLDAIPITALDAPFGFLAASIVHLPRIWRMVRAQKNPRVHLHGTGLLQLALMLALRAKKIPHVWTLHGITAIETRHKFEAHRTFANFARHLFYTAIEHAMLRLSARVIVDTDYVRRALPAAAPKMRVIPQGIFPGEFAAMHASIRAEPLILSLGVIDARKGHHLTIAAFAQLQRAMPQAKLIIAGALKDAQYHQHLREQIAALHLTDAITIHTDLARCDVLSLLSEAKIFALHSREESQGIALCEALAAGLPVVASRVGGIPYVVSEQADGLLTDYGDVTAFASAMQRLLADAPLYARMAAQARANAQRFDWSPIAERVMEIYAETLGS